MNRIAPLIALLAISTGCASSTIIRSNPSGATVRNQYGREICTTPCEYEDSEMVNHTETFTLEKQGYENKDLTIKRDNYAVGRGIAWGVGGIFFWPLWAGEVWSFDYDESYKVELKPQDGGVKVSSAKEK